MVAYNGSKRTAAFPVLRTVVIVVDAAFGTCLPHLRMRLQEGSQESMAFGWGQKVGSWLAVARV